MPRFRENLVLTAELVARIERTEPDPGPEPGSADHTEAEYRAMAKQMRRPQRHFGYLPRVPYLESGTRQIHEQQLAIGHGWHRAFCLGLTRWRGTRELPALILA